MSSGSSQPRGQDTPYRSAPRRAFWRSGVVRNGGAGLAEIAAPKVRLGAGCAVATAGSCFAQNIGRHLARAGVTVLDAEPLPPIVPDSLARRFGYRLFSGRYGNIYTARQLRQLLQEIIAGAVDPRCVWPRQGGGFTDAFRPTVEPGGLRTGAEVLLHRDYHLERTAQMLREAQVFVFTLGLTEAWEDRETGRVFPLCPGLAGGRFDSAAHRLRRFRYGEVTEDLRAILALLRRFNPAMEMILTVSPVPLTATATGEHVLPATCAAKATLRAAAGDFAEDTGGVDYFPAFELVTSHATGGPWFEANQRTVSRAGVAMVMARFLAAQGLTPNSVISPPTETPGEDNDEALVCDELLLEAAR